MKKRFAILVLVIFLISFLSFSVYSLQPLKKAGNVGIVKAEAVGMCTPKSLEDLTVGSGIDLEGESCLTSDMDMPRSCNYCGWQFCVGKVTSGGTPGLPGGLDNGQTGYCGDGVCDVLLFENSETCSQDCSDDDFIPGDNDDDDAKVLTPTGSLIHSNYITGNLIAEGVYCPDCEWGACTKSVSECDNSYCGDCVKDSGEECDKGELNSNSATCSGYGCFYCDFSCDKQYPHGYCGDGDVQSPDEECDLNLPTDTSLCTDLGFDTGYVYCTDCQIDYSDCHNYECGDGIDNDEDGLTDYPEDPGCDSDSDDSEGCYEYDDCEIGESGLCNEFGYDYGGWVCTGECLRDQEECGYWCPLAWKSLGLECDEYSCSDSIDNNEDNLVDCLDPTCESRECDDKSICISNECVEISYVTPEAKLEQIQPDFSLTTFVDFLSFLQQGVVFSSDDYSNLVDGFNGNCNDFCNSYNSICGFADAGRNDCYNDGSNMCTCY